MASIRKRVGKRKTAWIVDYINPDGKRKQKSFLMKKYAKAYKARIEVNINEGVYVDPEKYKKQTLKTLIKKILRKFKQSAKLAYFKEISCRCNPEPFW